MSPSDTGDREIELKLLCAPDDLGRVLAAAPAGDEESRELISVYFDTADGVLRKAGASLRVRESGGRRVQTLKRGQGLSREEYEEQIPGRVPDRNVGPLRELLPDTDAANPLKPAFNVRVTRRQRLLRYGDALIELALDQGEVRGGRRKSPISEVELELKDGDPRALFDLARELGKAAPLYLSFEGKAARGEALVAADAPADRRKARTRLADDADAAQAFQAIARAALQQIAGAAQTLRGHPKAPETRVIHQLRVATRRLRSALSTFGDVVRDAGLEGVKADLRWLAKATNDVRDLDVFAAETLIPALAADPALPGGAALSQALEAARAKAAKRCVEAVSSERFRALLIDVTAWVETGDWLALPDTAALRSVPAVIFAMDALQTRRRKLRKAAKGLAKLDDAARHKARIQAKKLRYAADGFASLFDPKPVRAYIDRLKAVQDELGALNDQVTAQALPAKLALDQDAAFALGLLVGGKAAAAPDHLARAAKALQALNHADAFWR